MIAFTKIRHGKPDGTVVVIEEGETVKGLPEDVVAQLKEQGIIGDKPEVQSAENDELAKENADLRKQLEELQAQLKEKTPPAPAPSK